MHAAIDQRSHDLEYFWKNALPADPVHKAGNAVYIHRSSFSEGGCERGGCLRLDRVDPCIWFLRMNRASNSSSEPAPSERDDHRVHSCNVFEYLQADGPVPCDHPLVAERMDEQGISERSILVTGHYLPDLIVRDLDRLRSEPFNGLQLRLGSVIGNYCSTRNAVLPSLPSQGLRHVSRATRVYSTRPRLLPSVDPDDKLCHPFHILCLHPPSRCFTGPDTNPMVNDDIRIL